MEIYTEKIELTESSAEITIFQNYGDQLTMYGVPAILEGFWAYISLTDKDGKPIVGFPVSEDNGQLKLSNSHAEALDLARDVVKLW